MAKRALDGTVGLPSEANEGQGVEKKIKASDPEGSWMCPFCQNVNWPRRTVCNKRGCSMPRDLEGVQHPEGSWACEACRNINWPKRTNCNKCHIPRPGSTATTGASSNDHQPGSWVCPVCTNVNWPRRTTCNRSGCGTPKPLNAGMGAQPFFDAYNQQNMMGSQLGLLSGMGGMAGMSANPYLAPGMFPYMDPTATVGSQHPPGSWRCSLCGNVNWPKRTTCNRQGCGAPRPAQLQTGAVAQSVQQPHPEGSWSCETCGNINWPARTSCNRRGCETPRPIGAPEAV